ncbi:phytanoyl-CoA dioxygenase family protein [Sphingobium yanoikuyae]|uniref:phytanoyl-CoA dioxygenase family protein n=1 Tax=Sphingobium yanoikuyae TaxID=13690 RepID=UPI0026F07477|nr:phytanoyl-CoA dioxygenase family protein [Sphingobium yanoikuyae]
MFQSQTPVDGACDRAIIPFVDQLARDGWCIMPDALPAPIISRLDDDLAEGFDRAPYCRGPFYGETTKRLGRLPLRSVHSEALICHAGILAIVQRFLGRWCDHVQLNTTQAIAIDPGAPAQAPHRDQDMFHGPKGEMEYLLNVIWPLTPFHPENGGTRIWPRSHGSAALGEASIHEEQAVAPVLAPGSALLFLGSTMHGAGANRSASVRRAVVIGYSLGWLKPYENPWLAYPPSVARRFSSALAALAGYIQHRPNLGNFEGQCPSKLLTGGPELMTGPEDALLPAQAEMVEAYCRAQQVPG